MAGRHRSLFWQWRRIPYEFSFPADAAPVHGSGKADRTPIDEILARTPELPENCQWGSFLRCHDELTLEMVTPEERKFMWDYFAPEPRMRLNMGIRRRLAPLLSNDQRQIRLLHAVLLSIIGSPVLYYGDEIGMGDNIYPGRSGWGENPHAMGRECKWRIFQNFPREDHAPGDRR